MVRMPRSARPAAMRGPMCLTSFTGVESWSGTGLMVAAEGLRKRFGWERGGGEGTAMGSE